MLFQCPEPDELEQRVVEQIEDLRQQLSYVLVQEPRRWTGLLRRVMFAKSIQSSNSIEGFNVTLEDAMAAVEGEDPLEADPDAWLAVRNYRVAMTYVLQLAKDPHFSYSQDLIRSLHFMMLSHDLAQKPGTYRPGFIYVRASKTGEIVYEGPEAQRVPALVDELVDELNDPPASNTPPMVRAAMAHLNLVLIHPFKDGNGRMARCLQTLVLGREGVLEPEFSSIEEDLGTNTDDYYKVLSQVAKGYWQPENDARPWIRFCLRSHYRQARTIQRRMKEAEKLWDLLARDVERRRLADRTIGALFDASMGYKVRRATYQPFADVSDQVATRDLKVLVDQGLLVPHGEKRGRFYLASDELKVIRAQSLEVRMPMDDPFSTQERQRA
jgi:Fic family protein